MKIGIVGMGEMGAAIGGHLVSAGHDVATDLQGRGTESVERASEAGVLAVDSLQDLVIQSDLLFSIVPPVAAEGVAETIGRIAREHEVGAAFVEANAVSPKSLRRMEAFFDRSSMSFVDAGIVGSPPSASRIPRLYVSGPSCSALDCLDGTAFEIVDLGDAPGLASGFKLSYAGLTKGANVLLTAVFISACRQGFLGPYVAELKHSQPELLRRAEANISRLPADAARWVREMEEVRDTFAELGLPGGFHQAASEMMRLLADSRFAAETRRTRDRSRTAIETVTAIVDDQS